MAPISPSSNPVKLGSFTLREDVCNQCHLSSPGRATQPGKQRFDFRPGMPLDAVIDFVSLPVRPRRTPSAVNHVEQMRESACYTGQRRESWTVPPATTPTRLSIPPRAPRLLPRPLPQLPRQGRLLGTSGNPRATRASRRLHFVPHAQTRHARRPPRFADASFDFPRVAHHLAGAGYTLSVASPPVDNIALAFADRRLRGRQLTSSS